MLEDIGLSDFTGEIGKGDIENKKDQFILEPFTRLWHFLQINQQQQWF